MVSWTQSATLIWRKGSLSKGCLAMGLSQIPLSWARPGAHGANHNKTTNEAPAARRIRWTSCTPAAASREAAAGPAIQLASFGALRRDLAVRLNRLLEGRLGLRALVLGDRPR